MEQWTYIATPVNQDMSQVFHPPIPECNGSRWVQLVYTSANQKSKRLRRLLGPEVKKRSIYKIQRQEIASFWGPRLVPLVLAWGFVFYYLSSSRLEML